jgi:hypothetical protein
VRSQVGGFFTDLRAALAAVSQPATTVGSCLPTINALWQWVDIEDAIDYSSHTPCMRQSTQNGN